MPDKDFKIRFSAQQDGTFGRAVQETTDGLRSLKSEAASLASSFTGGLVGGGVFGLFNSILGVIGRLADSMRQAKRAADEMNISIGSAHTIKSFETATGMDGSVEFGVQAARRARADALAGDPAAAKAFQDIGLNLKEIERLNPGQLFYRISQALKPFDPKAANAREQFNAASRLLGGNQSAERLLPFIAGGLFQEPAFFTESRGVFAKTIAGDPTYLAKFKKDFEPFSEFGVDTASRAAKLAEGNRFRAAEIARSQLSIEEQINDQLAQRVQIERDLQSAPSELRRQQLISRLLDADQSLAALRAKRQTDLSQGQQQDGKGLVQSANLQRNLDDLSRAGFFTNGSPVALGNIQADQLKELKEIVSQLRKAPAETARAL